MTFPPSIAFVRFEFQRPCKRFRSQLFLPVESLLQGGQQVRRVQTNPSVRRLHRKRVFHHRERLRFRPKERLRSPLT